MKYRTALCIILSLVLFGSCNNSDDIVTNSEGVFIFGTYYGFCQGNCAHFFKLEGDEVFRDDIERFQSIDIIFRNESESNLLNAAQRVRNNFPELLLESNMETYGCPDCADQGTLYVQMMNDTIRRQWFIDTQIDAEWPSDLQNFAEIMQSELQEIIVF